ncbi:MAG: hypothetical protein RIB58_05970 [Phycisphaerales bacterium]
MTTAHSSTTFHRALRHHTPPATVRLRLRWAVVPQALGRAGVKPIVLELDVAAGEAARLTVGGQERDLPAAMGAWNGSILMRRVPTGSGCELLVADASPIAVAVIDPARPDRPLHVACDLPKALGLRGGRYELVGGGVDLD